MKKTISVLLLPLLLLGCGDKELSVNNATSTPTSTPTPDPYAWRDNSVAETLENGKKELAEGESLENSMNAVSQEEILGKIQNGDSFTVFIRSNDDYAWANKFVDELGNDSLQYGLPVYTVDVSDSGIGNELDEFIYDLYYWDNDGNVSRQTPIFFVVKNGENGGGFASAGAWKELPDIDMEHIRYNMDSLMIDLEN